MATPLRLEGRIGVPLFRSQLKSRPPQNLYFSQSFSMLASDPPRMLGQQWYLVERDASGNYTLAPQNPSTNVTFSYPNPVVQPADDITLTVHSPPNELNGHYDYIGEVTTLGTGCP